MSACAVAVADSDWMFGPNCGKVPTDRHDRAQGLVRLLCFCVLGCSQACAGVRVGRMPWHCIE